MVAILIVGDIGTTTGLDAYVALKQVTNTIIVGDFDSGTSTGNYLDGDLYYEDPWDYRDIINEPIEEDKPKLVHIHQRMDRWAIPNKLFDTKCRKAFLPRRTMFSVSGFIPKRTQRIRKDRKIRAA